MNFKAWSVDLATLTATHESGFLIEIEGNPRDPSAVNPGRFPKELSGIEQARLLRHGMEAFAAAAKTTATEKRASKPAVHQKPAYITPANKPKRPVLSLKKRSEEEA